MDAATPDPCGMTTETALRRDSSQGEIVPYFMPGGEPLLMVCVLIQPTTTRKETTAQLRPESAQTVGLPPAAERHTKSKKPQTVVSPWRKHDVFVHISENLPGVRRALAPHPK
jgi:hypothetical protein